MKSITKQLPILLLALCIGILVAQALPVQGFILEEPNQESCKASGATEPSSNQNGKKVGIQINNDWYIWIDCQ